MKTCTICKQRPVTVFPLDQDDERVGFVSTAYCCRICQGYEDLRDEARECANYLSPSNQRTLELLETLAPLGSVGMTFDEAMKCYGYERIEDPEDAVDLHDIEESVEDDGDADIEDDETFVYPTTEEEFQEFIRSRDEMRYQELLEEEGIEAAEEWRAELRLASRIEQLLRERLGPMLDKGISFDDALKSVGTIEDLILSDLLDDDDRKERILQKHVKPLVDQGMPVEEASQSVAESLDKFILADWFGER
jgi:hypothetical protein